MPRKNGLLASLSTDDHDLLAPHLESVVLELRKSLERPNRRIGAAYFPEAGLPPSSRFNPTASESRLD